MFSQLQSMLNKQCKSINMLLTASDGKITVVVIPNVADGSDSALKQPLKLVATAEELDQGFAEALTQYASSHQSLAEQIAATQAILDAAKQASAQTAVNANKRSSSKNAGNSVPETCGDDESIGDNTSDEAQTVSGRNLFDDVDL